MEFNRCTSAPVEEARRRQEAGEDAAPDSGSRVVSEELDLVQMYLTCLPDRYMKAKFSLTAYLACWLVLKLCKVRNSSINVLALIIDFLCAEMAK